MTYRKHHKKSYKPRLPEPEDEDAATSYTDMSMSLAYTDMDAVIGQLADLRADAESALTDSDADALDYTLAILRALSDEGVTDAEQVKDMIFDYRQVNSQCAAMTRKYFTPVPPVEDSQNGLVLCPDCSHAVHRFDTRCYACGKALRAV